MKVVAPLKGGGTGAGHQRGPAYYLWTWPLLLLPWTPLALLVLWRLLPRQSWRSADRLDLYLLLWSILPLMLFSLSATKLTTYILPALPATALVIARAGAKGLLDDRWGRCAAIGSAGVVAAIALGSGLLLIDPTWLGAVLGERVAGSRLCPPPGQAPGSRALSLKHEQVLDMLRADVPTFSFAKRKNEAWIESETGAVPVFRASEYVLLANPGARDGLRAAGREGQSEAGAP